MRRKRRFFEGEPAKYIGIVLYDAVQIVQVNYLDKVVIKIIAKYSFSNEGIRCLNVAKNIIVNAGYYLEWETSSE